MHGYLYLKQNIVTSESEDNDSNGIQNITDLIHSRTMAQRRSVGNTVGPTLLNREEPEEGAVGYGSDGTDERDSGEWVEVWQLSDENGHASEHQEPLHASERVRVAIVVAECVE